MSELIPILTRGTGLSESNVRAIIRTAPARYYTFQVPKRSGGMRAISQPARELKALQRLLVSELLENLPVHSAATAYRKGLSIRRNAEIHKGRGPILKIDFLDFFPSIKSIDWKRYCAQKSIFKFQEDVDISSRILFKKTLDSTILRLAIGAPSSPCISNVLMYEFDEKVTKIVAKDQVTYTRYADDLTFSARRTGYLQYVHAEIVNILRELNGPALIVNEKKTVSSTRRYKRVVTGLVLTNDGGVSIGHEKKRLIRAMLHRASLGGLTDEELSRVSGMLAFISDVEPELYNRIEAKYGGELISYSKHARRRLVEPSDD